MKFKLTWENQNRFIEEGQTVNIGRHPDNDIVVQDIEVSRKHLVLKVIKGQFELRDVGSSKGTWHEGNKILDLKVNTSDSFKIGNVEFKVEYVPAPSKAAAAKPASQSKK